MNAHGHDDCNEFDDQKNEKDQAFDQAMEKKFRKRLIEEQEDEIIQITTSKNVGLQEDPVDTSWITNI